MPKGKLIYRRGEICWVQLDPTIGTKIRRRLLAADSSGAFNRFRVRLVTRSKLKAIDVECNIFNNVLRERCLQNDRAS
jgi:hypothetical protein